MKTTGIKIAQVCLSAFLLRISILGLSASMQDAAADQGSSSTIVEVHTGDSGLSVLGVRSEIGPRSVTITGRISRSRITRVLQQRELVIAIVDETGKELLSDRRIVGPHELPRRSSAQLHFSITLPHTPQRGEKIMVSLTHLAT